MLARDYIMRLIAQFFEALEKLKEKKGHQDESVLQAEVGDMYRSYFHQAAGFFYEAGPDIIVAYLKGRFPGEDYLQRLELLVELMDFDSGLQESVLESRRLQEKELKLLEHLDAQSDTYSFDRKRKMESLEALLSSK